VRLVLVVVRRLVRLASPVLQQQQLRVMLRVVGVAAASLSCLVTASWL
jgi:hypothetical protein